MADELTDHEGRPVPPDESDDAVIAVWCVSPHPGRPGYDMLERSWQKMLDYVRGELDCWLERHEIEDLEDEPVTLSFSIQRMSKSEYLGIVEGDE